MNELKKIVRIIVWRLRYVWLRYGRGIDLHKTSRIGSNVIFDRTYPQGIHIGSHTYITNNVTILTHDHSRSAWNLNTLIGSRCFIGNHAIIMPGLAIGDEVVIGAGSVVTKDIASNSIAAGNPARIIKSGISMSDDARIES